VDYQLVRGCNLFVFSAYDASPSGNRMGGGGPHFGPADPQWDSMSVFFARLSRLCGLLSQGRPFRRTAVLFDIRAAWASGEDAAFAERRHLEAARRLQEMQCDFDFVDDDQIAEARIEESDGRPVLVVGCMRYNAVVLPSAKWMRKEASAKLADFSTSGGVVESGDDFGRLPKVCRVSGQGASGIRVMKRTSGAESLYYFVNESLEPADVEIVLDETAALVRADPDTGAFVPFAADGGRFAWRPRGSESLALVSGARPSRPADDRFSGETVELDGVWETAVRRRVRVGEGRLVVEDFPDAAFAFGRLGDWRMSFGEEFSGRVAYRKTFVSPCAGAAELDLGDVCNGCSVKMNGRPAGAGYGRPYRFAVEVEKGTNVLEVTVANSLVNALSPQYVRDYIYSAFPPRSYYERFATVFNRDGHESGLIGPVRLAFKEREK